jgi:hypothetical protein
VPADDAVQAREETLAVEVVRKRTPSDVLRAIT